MIDILNAIIKVIGVVLSQLVGLLPTSPLTVPQSAYDSLATVMGYAAYFLPLAEVRTLLVALVAATLIWYGIRIIMRFFRTVTA